MLLTGFEGYGGRSDNPSAMVASSLDGASIAGQAVVSRVLPVTMSDIQFNIESLIDEHRPQLVVCLGLAPGEPMIRVEKFAINSKDFQISDNQGELSRGALIDGAPAAFEATLPVHSICDGLLAGGIPAYVSYTAGTFLCNAVSYYALRYCLQNYPQTRVGFIHLPYLPSQVRDLIINTRNSEFIEIGQRSDLASMAFEVQRDAIKRAIEICIEDDGSITGSVQ